MLFKVEEVFLILLSLLQPFLPTTECRYVSINSFHCIYIAFDSQHIFVQLCIYVSQLRAGGPVIHGLLSCRPESDPA